MRSTRMIIALTGLCFLSISCSTLFPTDTPSTDKKEVSSSGTPQASSNSTYKEAKPGDYATPSEVKGVDTSEASGGKLADEMGGAPEETSASVPPDVGGAPADTNSASNDGIDSPAPASPESAKEQAISTDELNTMAESASSDPLVADSSPMDSTKSPIPVIYEPTPMPKSEVATYLPEKEEASWRDQHHTKHHSKSSAKSKPTKKHSVASKKLSRSKILAKYKSKKYQKSKALAKNQHKNKKSKLVAKKSANCKKIAKLGNKSDKKSKREIAMCKADKKIAHKGKKANRMAASI